MEAEKNESFEIKRWLFRGLLFIYDVFAVNIAFFMAIIIRFYIEYRWHDMGAQYIEMWWKFTPIYTCVCLMLFIVFRLYSGVWKYVGMNDVRRLLLANICTCLCQIGGSLLIVGRMPITYYAIGAFLQLFLMSLPRIAPRFIIDTFGAGSGARSSEVSVPTLIVGVGENARIIQNTFMKDRSSAVKPMCVVEFGKNYRSSLFNGLSVYHDIDGLMHAIEKYGIKCIVLSDDHLSESVINEIHRICDEKDIEFRSFAMRLEQRDGGVRLQSLLEMTDGPVIIERVGAGDNVSEERYSNTLEALDEYKNNYVIESVSGAPDAIKIRVHRIRSANVSMDEEWVKKYREENRGEVSFFV